MKKKANKKGKMVIHYRGQNGVKKSVRNLARLQLQVNNSNPSGPYCIYNDYYPEWFKHMYTCN